MKNVANTIEDLLEILAGLQRQAKIQIESNDATIMYSIARQTFKGTALTDRQYALMKEKLQTYRNQFTSLDYDFDRAVDNLRIPLRHIDRSKYIEIVDTPDVFMSVPYESYKQKCKWIKIRFPFSKKLILSIESLPRYKSDYFHEKGSHEHYFKMTELNVFKIVNEFKNKEFVIDQNLLELYEELKFIDENKENYIPGIYNYELKNVNPKIKEILEKDLGSLSTENLVLYKDRARRYGLHYFDSTEIEKSLFNITPLSKKIVSREKINVQIKPQIYPVTALTQSLLELKRFPLLVMLNEKTALDELSLIHSHLCNFIDTKQCSVLFRLDNDSNLDFNLYIKNNSLNNPIDKNTKVVYINTSKVPKPLIKSGWQAQTILFMSSYFTAGKGQILLNQSDLVIHYDNNVSQMMRFQKQGIEEL